MGFEAPPVENHWSRGCEAEAPGRPTSPSGRKRTGLPPRPSPDPLTSREACKLGSQTLSRGDREGLKRSIAMFVSLRQRSHGTSSHFSSPCMFFLASRFLLRRLGGNQSTVIRRTRCQLQSSLRLSEEGQPGMRLHNHAHGCVHAR